MTADGKSNDGLDSSSQRTAIAYPGGTDGNIAAIASEEFFNSITHGLGLLLGIAAFVGVMIAAARHGGVWPIVGCAIYGATLVAVYGASTLSHVFHSQRQRRFFRSLDQGCIYLFIAGTYTPLALVYLREGW